MNGSTEDPGHADRMGESDDTTPAARSLLEALLDTLAEAGRDRSDLEPHVRAYMAWVKGNEAEELLEELGAAASTLRGGERTYRHVAVLGFASSNNAGLKAENHASLVEGVEWLAGREWFAAGRVPTFEADPIALLGVVVGIIALRTKLGDEFGIAPSVIVRFADWIDQLLPRSLQIVSEPWERGLVVAAQYLGFGSQRDATIVRSTAPDLAAALAANGLIALSASDERAAIESIFKLSYRGSGAERAATHLVALRWLYRTLPTALPGRASVTDVMSLLRGVARSLRRWRWENTPSTRGAALVRWEINNEYHVQDLLWIVLAPVFPDLEDEENLPSLGQKHPRYDLGVPSLKLIVEVKFVYRGDRREFAEVIEQVAADASLYLRDKSRYVGIIAVVWDDSRHTEQYAELEHGLLAIGGVLGAVVITRPGRMGAGLRN